MRIPVTIVALWVATAAGGAVPPCIARQIPEGYDVLTAVPLAAGAPARSFEIVALGRKDEAWHRSGAAPARPLLVFERKGNRFILSGRNDDAVLRADEGGQCDPFIDGEASIAVKGRYFTVENGVACGQHWTDYVTFRLDDGAQGFVFDNERYEAWELNPSNDPNAEALVRAGPPRVTRARPGHATPFAAWRRAC